MSILDLYFARIAAAFVRGRLSNGDPAPKLPLTLSEPHIDELSEDDQAAIIDHGLSAGLKLNKFKRTMGLARVDKVLGILKGITANELLDIGSGRGAFLWPLIDLFPDLDVKAIDCSDQRVHDINCVKSGGLTNLSADLMDVINLDLPDDSYDVVTMLEVLEHIPNAQDAINEVVRVAKRFIIFSVPSKEDDNPEHIHLFDQKRLIALLENAGVQRVRFDYVLNHIIAIAKINRES